MASRTRGTNPYQNPFTSAVGGRVGYNGGGDFEDDSGDPAAWSASSLGRGDYTPTATTRIDPDTGEYFIDTVAGSGAEQQSFLRGKFEQQAPSDYRHGFEKEFDFFTQVDDPELDRSLDLFGSGASDRLAGLYGLTPEQLDAYYDSVGLSADGRPLSSYDDITSQFSGVTGGISNVDAGVPVTTVGATTITPGTAADITDIFSGDDATPAWELALNAITPPGEVDGDYSQQEIDAVVSLIDSGANRQQIADYYGISLVDLMREYDYIKLSGTLRGITTTPRDQDYSQTEIDAIMGLIDSGADREQIAAYYGIPLTELMGYYNAIKAAADTTTTTTPTTTTPTTTTPTTTTPTTTTPTTTTPTTTTPTTTTPTTTTPTTTTPTTTTPTTTTTTTTDTAGAGIPAWEAALNEITAVSDVDGDYSEAEIDAVWNLYMDGGASAGQIAGYYDMSEVDVLAYLDEISAAKAGDTYNRAIDTSTIAGAATVPTVTQGQVDTIIGDTTSVRAGVTPETGAWTGTSYIGDEGGTLEAAYATAEYENRETQEQNIRDYVATNYGEPPYTQEQAVGFSADAIAGNVAAETVSSALNVPLATVEAFYEMAGSIGDDIELGALGVAGGGRVGARQFMTSFGPVHLQAGGIADIAIEPQMSEELVEETFVEEPVETDYPELVDMTIEAIKGNLEDSDAIIEQFIAEYGAEAFQALRDAVLKSIAGNPEAQTEGMIVGTGGGMDDEVMGVIGEQQDIAVSPDEYIVAADVVSGLGDGSSQAGADILDEIAANVRSARSGGRQPAPINLSRIMPT
jgi:hypothetical protein